MQLKKQLSIFIAFALVLALAQTTFAQRQDREREERERPAAPEPEKELPKDFKSRLWYGGGVNIGFGAFNGASTFVFGVSPMVGYKIIRGLSAGPRVAFDFTSYKEAGYKSIGLTSYDVGGFVRYRVFRGLFFQGELSNNWFQGLNVYREKVNVQRVNQRLGLGWNFGEPGGTGSEISVLYNFKIANDINTWENPIEYRFGFTWKF